jgi:hypothetical protein
MTTKLEKILELLNLNFQNGRINKKDFETLRWLIILYEDYIKRIEIEDIHNFTIGLVELKRIGYDKKDISTILIWILNLGIKEIGKILFEVSTYIHERYKEEFEKFFNEKSKSIRKIIESSPNIDSILDNLKDKIKILFNDNDKTYIEMENSIENIKKYNLSLGYIYSIIQIWQDSYYIEKLENIESQISCTVKNLEDIKNILENIEKDPKYAKNLKDIQNIKKELNVYYNKLLDIKKDLSIYKQSYIEFEKKYLSKLLLEGLNYIKEYRNANLNKSNINKNYEQNILYH